jgi:hypothetical protein
MNPAALMRDFLWAASLAREATGLTAVREFSSHDAGVWQLRDAQNESICEVSPEGVVVAQLRCEGAPAGLLDRIGDLRALGFPTRAIYEWFGMPESVAHLTETRVMFEIAMQHYSQAAEPKLEACLDAAPDD